MELQRIRSLTDPEGEHRAQWGGGIQGGVGEPSSMAASPRGRPSLQDYLSSSSSSSLHQGDSSEDEDDATGYWARAYRPSASAGGARVRSSSPKKIARKPVPRFLAEEITAEDVASNEQSEMRSQLESSTTSAPTLDGVDIESLIASYGPLIHPSMRDSILERQNSILSARERSDAASRAGASTMNGRSVSYYDQSSASSSSRPSLVSTRSAGSSTSLRHLPSATSNPLRREASAGAASGISRKSSTSSYTSIFKRKTSYPHPQPAASAAQPSGQFLSGAMDITYEAAAGGSSALAASASSAPLNRTAGVFSYHQPSPSSQDLLRSQSNPLRNAPVPAPCAPESADIPLRSQSQSSADQRRQRTPTQTIPSRFTYATAAPEIQRLPSATKASETSSPRSSVSSSRSQVSFRWSVGSQTSSVGTSRTSTSLAPQSAKPVLDIERPAQAAVSSRAAAQPGARAEAERVDPSLAIGVASTALTGECQPAFTRGHRKNQESVDSMLSEDGLSDTISSIHFPVPPPLSRKNSAASAVSITMTSAYSFDSFASAMADLPTLSCSSDIGSSSGPRTATDDGRSVRSFGSGSGAGLAIPVHTSAPLKRAPSTSSLADSVRTASAPSGCGASTGITNRSMLGANAVARSRLHQVHFSSC